MSVDNECASVVLPFRHAPYVGVRAPRADGRIDTIDLHVKIGSTPQFTAAQFMAERHFAAATCSHRVLRGRPRLPAECTRANGFDHLVCWSTGHGRFWTSDPYCGSQQALDLLWRLGLPYASAPFGVSLHNPPGTRLFLFCHRRGGLSAADLDALIDALLAYRAPPWQWAALDPAALPSARTWVTRTDVVGCARLPNSEIIRVRRTPLSRFK